MVETVHPRQALYSRAVWSAICAVRSGYLQRATAAFAIVFAILSVASALAADDKQAVVAGSGIFKCHSKDGGLSFVSKIDASVHDCVEIANHSGSPADATVLSNPPASPNPMSAQDGSRHAEMQDARAARVKDMLATVSQWCADNQAPGLKPKDRDKAQSACVIDKMGTYKLLYP